MNAAYHGGAKSVFGFHFTWENRPGEVKVALEKIYRKVMRIYRPMVDYGSMFYFDEAEFYNRFNKIGTIHSSKGSKINDIDELLKIVEIKGLKKDSNLLGNCFTERMLF